MPEWWTYRPEDFLLFSPRVYWRMFELHNAQVWPLHLVTLSSGLGLAALALRRPLHHGRWIALILAMLWLFVGWSFLWTRYATINWAIAYVAPAFGLEAALLAVAATRSGLAVGPGRAGLPLAIAGIAVYPVVAPLFGRPWAEAEVFGIAPDPTAMATVGLLLCARGPMALVLLPIPAAWLLLSGLTLHAMGDPQAWIAFAAAGAAVAVPVFCRVFRS